VRSWTDGSARTVDDGLHVSPRVARLHQRAVAENAAGRPRRGAVHVSAALALLQVSAHDDPAGLAATPELPGPALTPAAIRPTATPAAIRSAALSTLTRPVSPAPDRVRAASVARLLATLAKSEVEMHGVDRGLATLARAWRWAVVDGDEQLLAFLHGQRALIHFRGGRFAEALAEFDAAARTFTRLPGLDRCRLLINRGALYVEMGDLRSARADLTTCVTLARELGLALVERIAVHNLGCLEFIAGDLPLALRTMDEGMELDGETQAGIAFLDRARVLLAAGLHAEADDTLAAAARQLSRDRCWQDVGEVELTRAESALLAGDVPAARRLAARARDRFRRHGNARWRRNAELVLLQADATAGRPAGRLVPPALRLAEEFSADGFGLQARTARLLAAENLQRLGRLTEAAELSAQAGAARAADPVSLRLHTRYVRARLDFATGRATAGHRQLRAGLADLAGYQAHFGSIDLQTASAVHGRRLAELDLEVALRGGRPLSVLSAVERSRAVSGRLRAVRPPPDDEVADKLAELRQILDVVASMQAARGSGAVSELSERRRRAAELQRELRARSWQAGGSGEAVRPVGWSDVQARLGAEDTALVCYVEAGGAIHAVISDGAAPVLRALADADEVAESVRRMRADLDVLANGYLSGGMLAAIRSSLSRSLDRLDRLLVRSLRLSDRRLVVLPTGGLGALAWGSLPSLAGRPVVVAPSATAWLAAAAPSRCRRPTVAAFAGPGLARAAEEVNGIGALWPDAAIFTDQVVRRDALVSALTSATVVHVAAHGQHQAENPLFSSIRLADGPVFAYELDQTARAAEHVVLSACELGQATIRPGDEALGLTSVLLHLGTRCVVSGVARVHDDVSAEVMVRYHTLLAEGTDSAQALATACAEQHELPAPFVCFGATW
jgi:tetratricopeptide (TPR) repeat protein